MVEEVAGLELVDVVVACEDVEGLALDETLDTLDVLDICVPVELPEDALLVDEALDPCVNVDDREAELDLADEVAWELVDVAVACEDVEGLTVDEALDAFELLDTWALVELLEAALVVEDALDPCVDVDERLEALDVPEVEGAVLDWLVACDVGDAVE